MQRRLERADLVVLETQRHITDKTRIKIKMGTLLR